MPRRPAGDSTGTTTTRTPRRRKLVPATVLIVLVLGSACSTGDGSGSIASGGGASGDDASGERSGETTPQRIEGDPARDVPSALESITADGLPEPLVDPEDVRPGGPPPDGIPPIDEPRFLRAGEVDFLADNEPVLSLTVAEETRAYPIQIMIWHEIVNDTFGTGPDAVPVTVTYCPLCNSGVAFSRELGGATLDFGTSGMLYNSALVMYDRQSESLWSQFEGLAIAGAMTGEELETLPVATVSWAEWRKANPDALVLSRDTGEERPYGENPYPGYDDVRSGPFAFVGEVDDRMEAKQRVLGVGAPDDPVAIVLADLLDEGVSRFRLGNREVMAWALPGTASALDSGVVAEGRDVGATGVFVPGIDGRALTFTRTAGSFTDAETGSRWNVLGESTSGPLAGQRLERIEHVDTFWFAWAAFSPDTRVL